MATTALPRVSVKDQRVILLVIAVVRVVLGAVALSVAPWLWRHHFVVLSLLRPTKEVLLAGGYLSRTDAVPMLLVAISALPLLLGGVWLFYFLGRAYRDEIKTGELPGLAGRLLPPHKIKAFEEVLAEKGPKVIFVGRLAALPSSAVAAAAGASGVRTRTFLIADTLGALAALAEVLAAGYLLGDLYKRAGLWITALGFVVLVVLVVMLARWVRRT